MKGKFYAVSWFARVFMVHSCVAACKNKLSGIAIFFFLPYPVFLEGMGSRKHS